MEEAKKTIASKDQKLQDDAKTISDLNENIQALTKELQARNDVITKQEEQQKNDIARIKDLEGSLNSTQSQLNNTTNELKEIRSLSCKVVDGSKEYV